MTADTLSPWTNTGGGGGDCMVGLAVKPNRIGPAQARKRGNARTNTNTISAEATLMCAEHLQRVGDESRRSSWFPPIPNSDSATFPTARPLQCGSQHQQCCHHPGTQQTWHRRLQPHPHLGALLERASHNPMVDSRHPLLQRNNATLLLPCIQLDNLDRYDHAQFLLLKTALHTHIHS